jgi:hypothetical protein
VKTLLLVAIFSLLIGCEPTTVKYQENNLSKLCVGNVVYIRYDRSIAPLLKETGKPVLCSELGINGEQQ